VVPRSCNRRESNDTILEDLGGKGKKKRELLGRDLKKGDGRRWLRESIETTSVCSRWSREVRGGRGGEERGEGKRKTLEVFRI